MGQYSKRGLYSKYKKNNKERAELDYYSTPKEEVTNVLNKLQLDFYGYSVLEPCIGGGHMMEGILDYSKEGAYFGTDIKDRGYNSDNVLVKYDLDFLADDYPFDKMDYVIMNPPYSILEPFVIRGLEIAEKGLLVLGRLKTLEGQARYENIFKENPPTLILPYVDRIKCYKNGDTSITGGAIEAYAWFYWDKSKKGQKTQLEFLRRVGK